MTIGARGGAVGWGTVLQVARSRVWFPMVSHWRNPSGRTMFLRFDLASNRNEYQECFLGVKAAGAWGWQHNHFHVPIVLKAGMLNILEASGPVQDCNGSALPLP
jgi:hypothetical protein